MLTKDSGWWGIDVKVQPYNGSFWVHGSYTGDFTASLVSDLTNDTFGSETIAAQSGSGWTQYNYSLTPTTAAPSSNNSFVLTFDATCVQGGSLDFNLISLFPPTYKNRPNGMRPDLMEALAQLNPSFLRLAGGNNIEGIDPPNLWYWNQTIGPLTDRPGRPGTWGYENTGKLDPQWLNLAWARTDRCRWTWTDRIYVVVPRPRNGTYPRSMVWIVSRWYHPSQLIHSHLCTVRTG